MSNTAKKAQPTCGKCGRAAAQLDRLLVNYDDARHEREPLRADLCRKCVTELDAWLKPRPDTALDRLKTFAPQGPPFLQLPLLDLQTVQCLARGGCNSRAEIAARTA